MTSLRTSLVRARGLGSAKAGTETFWRQRLTSVLGLPLSIALIVIVLACIGVDHATATARVGNPFVATLLLLTLLNFCVHMRIGMQIIIEDYVHGLFAGCEQRLRSRGRRGRRAGDRQNRRCRLGPPLHRPSRTDGPALVG